MTTSDITKTEAAATSKETQRLVYVGPTIVRIQAIRNRVYIGEIPAKMKDEIAKNPWFGNLFVPFDLVSEAQVSIRKKSGAYYEAYKLAQDLADSMK